MKDKCCSEQSEVVGLAGVVLGILLVVIIMFLIFAKEAMVTVLPTIVWAFVILGMVLGLITLKEKPNAKKK